MKLQILYLERNYHKTISLKISSANELSEFLSQLPKRGCYFKQGDTDFQYIGILRKSLGSFELNIPAIWTPGNTIKIVSTTHIMSLPQDSWTKALKWLRPDQYKKDAPVVYLEISCNFKPMFGKERIYVTKRVLARVLYQQDGNKIVEMIVPGVYGYGCGPTDNYRYYYLHADGDVYPIDYEVQNLIKPLVFELPLSKCSTYKDITSELPTECPICLEALNHKSVLRCMLRCQHILCQGCAIKMNKCPMCRNDYRVEDIYN